ncbi:MAG: LemA family protein [Pseudomonadota bacterium]|nr:LemA family protein [Pseudomonadota bacterium]
MSTVMGFLSSMFWLLLLVAVVLGVVALKSYNRLQALAQLLREAASNTEVAVSRKLSQVNQLIDLVRNYQEFEQFTHLKLSADNTESLGQAWSQAGQVLTAIQGMAQRFPELRTSDQYTHLAASIQDSEQAILQARERYNAAVRNYNTVRASIPTVFVAGWMNFSEAPFLEFDHSGVVQVNSLREFKTGDSDRLQQLLQDAGHKLADGSKALAVGTVQAGRALQERLRDTSGAAAEAAESVESAASPSSSEEVEQTFFYLLPGGVPQGPVSRARLQELYTSGDLAEGTQAALAGSANWKPVSAYV